MNRRDAVTALVSLGAVLPLGSRAQALGLTIPQSLMIRADRVIE